MQFPVYFENLITELSRLPGIGRKTAQRLAIFITDMEDNKALSISRAIEEAVNNLKPCDTCGCLTDNGKCLFCSDPLRNDDVICVVENTIDIVAMEKLKNYKGRYHVLGGVISPLDGIGPDHLRIDTLLDRVVKYSVKEVILATSVTIEGEATANYIAKELEKLGIKATRIAKGIPVGGKFDYIDAMTMQNAIDKREEM